MQTTTHVRFVFSHDRYQRAIKQFQKALQSFTHPYLIVADLDGTLLNQQGIITAPSQKVLTLLQEAGHVVCLATGRPWRAAKGHYYQLGLKTLITTLNGAVIHDPFYPHNELKFMFSIKLLKDLIADGEIIAIINNILVEDGEKMHFLNPPTKQELIDLGTWLHLNFTEDQPMIGFQDLFANQNCINGLLIQISTNVDIDKIISLIKNKFHTLNCQFWVVNETMNVIEVKPAMVNKGNALDYLASFYGIGLDRTIAFGDGMNDMSMLAKAHYGYAMKNGKTTAKFVARGVTKGMNHYDGLAQKIVNFFTKLAFNEEIESWFIKG